MRARLCLGPAVATLAAGALAADLAGTGWLPVEVAGAKVPQGVAAGVRFGADGTVSGSSGCNRFTASYALDVDAISFGPVASTRRACPGPVMAFETVFLGALAAAGNVRRAGADLVLADGTGQTVMRLAPAPGQ